jgi:uncharacterized protein (TIGR02246 family)
MIGLTVACQPAAPPDTRAADAEAIRSAATGFTQGADAKDIESWLSLYAEDASIFPPNAPLATGKEGIRSALAPLFSNPGFSLSLNAIKLEVARAGDLAYRTGTYEMTLNDAAGKPQTDKGKWVEVWKKQSDGTWKVVADIFNSNLPPPGAPASH